MRRVESDGRVGPTPPAEAETAARGADASVFSLDDVGGDESLAERLAALSPVAAVTRGAGGCRIFDHGTEYAIPAPREREIDPTGAGDIFAAVFFLRLKETGDPAQAGRLAVALASLSVTRAGLAGVPTAAEILEAKRTVPAA
jgi:sugar/nucleoside kinase (ribokinase family)